MNRGEIVTSPLVAAPLGLATASVAAQEDSASAPVIYRKESDSLGAVSVPADKLWARRHSVRSIISVLGRT